MPRLKDAAAPIATTDRVRIAHLSDFHWGYRGDWNRDVAGTLERVLSQVSTLDPRCDLVVVTGDLIQATPDLKQREQRLAVVKGQLDQLKIPWLAVPGEHDVFGDQGQAFSRLIGPLHFFKRVHGLQIVGLDNVSRGYFLGHEQRRWLRAQKEHFSPDMPLVVLSHAPLFDVFEPWSWYTFDGAQAFGIVGPAHYLYGHIHQVLDHRQGPSMMNTSGLPTSWPLPSPGAMVRLEPWPQGATHPDMGLGFRFLDLVGNKASVHTSPLESVDEGAMRS